jgi:hypothetical protein
MAHPWELDNRRVQLQRRLGAYVLAMRRTTSWDGGSLTRRRLELRALAEQCGWKLQLELILKQLERDHGARPGTSDHVTTAAEKQLVERVVLALQLRADAVTDTAAARSPSVPSD